MSTGIAGADQPQAKRSDDSVEWGRLMAAAQNGHGGAYRRLLTELHRWLTRYFARRLPPSLVEDAVQDVLIAVDSKRHTYQPDRPFGPWLGAIARYKWIDRLRAMGRERSTPLDDQIAIEDHGDTVRSAIVLDDLLQSLKPAQAAAIRLVKLQGLSVEEAAASTGQSESLIKVNIHRGLLKLAALVQTSDAEP